MQPMQMHTRTGTPRAAIAAAVNARTTMEPRNRTPASVRHRNSARLRESLQPKTQMPSVTLPRVIGLVILVLALLLIAVGAVTA
jgi:hypothetical protein